MMLTERGKPDHVSPILDYDPSWPLMFEKEKNAILEAIGEKVVAMEHVGSTAIPGMRAKPIIDILIALQQLGDAIECMEPLRRLGYEYRPLNETIIPRTRFFRKGPPGSNTYHIRMVEKTGDLWNDYILFRDYLRTHREEAEEYAKLKADLHNRFGVKVPLEAKSGFVALVLEKARSAILG